MAEKVKLTDVFSKETLNLFKNGNAALKEISVAARKAEKYAADLNKILLKHGLLSKEETVVVDLKDMKPISTTFAERLLAEDKKKQNK